MIIVEGPDNSGKTCLIKQLCEQFPELTTVKSPGPKADYGWWMGWLKISPENLYRNIFDRFYFSELVYGPLVRHQLGLTLQEQEVLESMMWAATPLIIRCHLIDDEESFSSREQLFDWETARAAEKLYDTAFGDFEPIPYAWDPPSFAYVRVEVQDYLADPNQNQVCRTACNYGRGQMFQPKLMVVGEGFAKNNRWKVPFERSKSGIMLHRGLRQAGIRMSEVWFTNGIKTPGGMNRANIAAMAAEIEIIQPKRIIALGNHAAGFLNLARVEFSKISHPGYYLRSCGSVASTEFVSDFVELVQSVTPIRRT